MKLERNPFGITSDGKAVDSITMENANGIRCTFITYGASLTSFRMPDRSGHIDELTLGFDDLASYEGNHPYYGATVGRFANRIAKGNFSIDGIGYKIDINEPPNHLHGGKEGFSRKIWEMFPIRREKEAGATFTLTSEDGDAGFPGTVDVSLTVLLTEGNELIFPIPPSAINRLRSTLPITATGTLPAHVAGLSMIIFSPCTAMPFSSRMKS